MIERVTTLDLRLHLGDLLNRVAFRHDEFIIERRGKPLAAMIPVEKLHQLEGLGRLQLVYALAPKRTTPSQENADSLANLANHRSRKQKTR